MPERTEESWAHAQPERIDKDDQTERLTVVQHPAVYRQTEAAHGNTEEEDESYAQRYACYPDFA